jgi:hypothetical protein
MELLTPELRAQLPPLYAQDGSPDAIAYVKFFVPNSNWTWYASEFDGLDTLPTHPDGSLCYAALRCPRLMLCTCEEF